MDTSNPQAFFRRRGLDKRAPDRFSYGANLKVGTVIAAAVGWYAGLALFVPLVLAFAIGFIFWRISGESRRRLVAVFSVQASQLIWAVAALMMLGLSGLQFFMLVDIVLWSVGLIWLMARPGKAPLIYLVVFQVVSVVVVVLNLVHVPLASPQSKGLTANVFLRVEALIFMFAIYRQIRVEERGKHVSVVGE
jgi:hypothetical protein